MFIERNVGELDTLFVELLIVFNNFYKENKITDVTVYAYNKMWNNVSNLLSQVPKPTMDKKYSRLIIDLTKDPYGNECDVKILNYELGKVLPADVKPKEGTVIFYKLTNVVIPLLLT